MTISKVIPPTLTNGQINLFNRQSQKERARGAERYQGVVILEFGKKGLEGVHKMS